MVEKDLTKDDIEEIVYCDSINHRFEQVNNGTIHGCPICGRDDLFIGVVIKGRKHDRYDPKILKAMRNKWKDCVI